MEQLLVQQLTKQYGKVKGLDGVSFKLTVGVNALLGPNGSGKSSFLRILTGELIQSGGNILFGENDIRNMGKNFRRRFGYVPQELSILPSFTLKEYLLYVAYLKGIQSNEAISEILDVAERVNLSDSLNRKLGGFSGGMKRRAMIAQSLLGNPDILILDEPTAGLDPTQRLDLKNILACYGKEKIIIYSTHIVPDVEEIATNLIFLKNGKVAAQGTPSSIKNIWQGQVWETKEAGGNRIIRAYTKDQETIYRVHSVKKPSDIALEVSPNLEDCFGLFY